ncbi:tektin-2 isoform X1 [Octopus bimaculoides]|nr:tektin-2 isoform X1 [Octopus bimaculoides]XP_052825731.1 tektin-2 isoform X1 [Octopus bimaculoides]|eukprot:XP_014774177.1 PREDICTED: tektin-2-like isoform X1 [Octopus bimaculoides]
MATELHKVHYQPKDWFTNNYSISTNSEREQKASTNCRQEGRYLRNETYAQTKWDEYHNNIRLGDRVDQIRKWKEILEKVLQDLDEEIGDLSVSKDLAEQQLEDMNLATDVNVENLTLREGHYGIDLTEDDPELELRKETQVINGIKALLQQRISESFEQLVRLQEARQQVQADFQDKNIAMDIDIDQYNLSHKSPNISFKPDPLRVPKGSTTPCEWEEFSHYNAQRAEAEVRGSRTLRETIHHNLQQARNDLETAQKSTGYSFRKRMHEYERAIKELEWQKKNLEEEIAELENDIRELNLAIANKRGPMKLAQTRLENRTCRPSVELCRDAPQYGLTDEVKQLEATIAALEEKLKQSQHSLDSLQKNLHTVNDELDRKNNSLMLDKRCMDVRERLKTQPKSTTERNITMTGLVRDKPDILAA